MDDIFLGGFLSLGLLGIVWLLLISYQALRRAQPASVADPSISFQSIPARCRFGWHAWSWWEDAGLAVHPGRRHDVLCRGMLFCVTRRVCAGCGKIQQRFIGSALTTELRSAKAAQVM